jgi:DNA repair protein RadC
MMDEKETSPPIDVKSLFTITEVALIYRNKVKPTDRRQIKTAADAYKILLATWDMNKIELVEEFKIVLLDRRSACLGVSSIASGGVNQCAIDAKLIFATALKALACRMILAHNHPSGSLQPSQADIKLTEQLVMGGKILSIDVLDHLIVTPHGYTSFADEGLMP